MRRRAWDTCRWKSDVDVEFVRLSTRDLPEVVRPALRSQASQFWWPANPFNGRARRPDFNAETGAKGRLLHGLPDRTGQDPAQDVSLIPFYAARQILWRTHRRRPDRRWLLDQETSRGALEQQKEGTRLLKLMLEKSYIGEMDLIARWAGVEHSPNQSCASMFR